MTQVRWAIGGGLVGVLILAAAAGTYVLLNQGPDVTARRISLKPPPEVPTSRPRPMDEAPAFRPQPADKLKIAVGAIISPAKSLAFYEEILDYIGEKLGRDVEMVQKKTYDEVNFLIEEGQIDAAFVCSRPYVKGHRDFQMELLCVPVCFGQTVYHSYFIVHKDSPIQSLEGLRDRTFAFSDPLSNSGRLVPVYTLAKMDETPESFFRKCIFTYSHDNSIRSVADRAVDGAAVDSLIWEYDYKKADRFARQTKVIYRSPAYAIPPVVVSARIDPKLKEKLRSAFLTMHEDRKGREILKKLLIDRFTTIDDSAYNSIREMEAFMKKFRSRQ